MTFNLRTLNWPGDRQALLSLDTSFTTEMIYRVTRTDTSFQLLEETIAPPLHKVYDLSVEVDGFPKLDYVLIAESDGQVVGIAGLRNETVDRRAMLMHLYINSTHRGQGIGRALIDAMAARAREWNARCIWLETQDVNYGAIRLYKRMGFEWCGLDWSLDEHKGTPTDETAVFFMLPLS